MAKAAVEKKKEAAGEINVEKLVFCTVAIFLRGLTPIISHKWSDKAKRMMPGHPEKETMKGKKEKRNPEEEAEGGMYRLEDNSIGFPATGFKAAIVGACRFFEKPTMVEAKCLISVKGQGKDQLVSIDCQPELREDIVRINNGKSTDLRYRNYLNEWSATLLVKFPPRLIGVDSIVNLVDAAGKIGVGDWRPGSIKSHTGIYGTWEVDYDNVSIVEPE